MNRITKSIGALVLITAISSNAFAAGWREDRHDGYRNDRHKPYRDLYRGNHHEERHGGDWVAPLVFLGIAGAMIGAASSAEHHSAPPAYYLPPAAPPVQQSQSMWYYCQSSQQYYPYAQYCSEGWRAVPSTPR